MKLRRILVKLDTIEKPLKTLSFNFMNVSRSSSCWKRISGCLTSKLLNNECNRPFQGFIFFLWVHQYSKKVFASFYFCFKKTNKVEAWKPIWFGQLDWWLKGKLRKNGWIIEALMIPINMGIDFASLRQVCPPDYYKKSFVQSILVYPKKLPNSTSCLSWVRVCKLWQTILRKKNLNAKVWQGVEKGEI